MGSTPSLTRSGLPVARERSSLARKFVLANDFGDAFAQGGELFIDGAKGCVLAVVIFVQFTLDLVQALVIDLISARGRTRRPSM